MDESVDQADTSQLLILIHIIFDDLSTQELSDEVEEGDFNDFYENIEMVSEEFKSRFVGFDNMKLNLYNDPL